VAKEKEAALLAAFDAPVSPVAPVVPVTQPGVHAA
jgi:hypothetical protein